MSEKLKYADVTEALRYLIEHMELYYVDDNGYVVRSGSDKIVQVNSATEPKDLIIFQEVIKDPSAVVLNPFTEGLGLTEDQDWLYKNMAATFASKVTEAYRFICESVLLHKDKKAKGDLPMSVVKLISPYMTLVNAKTLKEIDKFTANLVNFMSIYYPRKEKTARFRCSLFEGPSKREGFKFQKKTWEFMEKFTCKLFQLKANKSHTKILDDLSYKTSILGYPMLDAKLHLYYKLYDATNPVFKIMEDTLDNGRSYAVDLTTFGLHLSRLDEYFKLAKGAVQPNMVNTKPVPAGNMSPITDASASGMPLPPSERPLFSDPTGATIIGQSTMPRPDQMSSGIPLMPVASPNYFEVQPVGGIPGAAFRSTPGGPVVVGFGEKIVSKPPRLFGRR